MRSSALFLPAALLLVLASCQRADAPTASRPERRDADAAVACMAYLALQRGAVLEGRASGETVALDAASGAWRALAALTLSAAELDQYYASSVAVFDDATAETIATESAACVARAPRSQP